MPKPELLSPIQDFTSLQAAIQAGADAVYFGIRGFNMRAGAKNFNVNDLKKITKICHKNNIKAYLAINIIIYQNELKKVENILKKAKIAKIDAIICWDMAVLQMARKLGHEIHLSTQASVANSESAEFYKKIGVKRIILARECSLQDIKKINKQIPAYRQAGFDSAQDDIALELEIFIHGAMCVSVSGRCFLSQFNYGKSANRGECSQPCRRKYLIKEVSGSSEFEIGEDYILSPKDLCALPFIEKLIEAGITAFKIEGRNRSPEYVKTVTSVYREIIDYYFKKKSEITCPPVPGFGRRGNQKLGKKFNQEFEELKKDLMRELETVYNRGFSSGFYLGKPINEWTHSYGSQAKERKIHIGKIKHFYSKISVAEIEIQANKVLKIKDEIIILGPTTGILRQKIDSMEIEHKQIKKTEQNDVVAIKLNKLVRANDEVYKII
ncbi:MAG: peptidase U32 family protein [Candidatus Kuenenbacteria bacterium]